MPLSITVDRESLDLSVKLLQSSSVTRARMSVAGNGYGQLTVSDPSSAVASTSLAGKSGTPVAGKCDVPVAALRKSMDAVPSYASSVTITVSPASRTSTGPGPTDYVDSKAEVKMAYGSSSATVYDPSISAVP